MTSIETVGSQVFVSELSATLVSLRERFEAVRRGEIQRVRRRLGNFESGPPRGLSIQTVSDP